MIFGISETKRTLRNREVPTTVFLWQMETLMCYCTVFALFYFEFEGNFRVQSIWGFSSFLKKNPLLNIRQLSTLRAVVSPGRTLRHERRETTAPQNNYNSNIILNDKSVFLKLFEVWGIMCKFEIDHTYYHIELIRVADGSLLLPVQLNIIFSLHTQLVRDVGNE